jgi:ATP-dependent Clp endopeptidase proteolytic subunit ClpP
MRNLKTARQIANLRQGRNDWYRITNEADVAQVYIYDEIGYFGVSASDFVKDIINIKQPKMDLHINSPGGEVFDGIAIYNAIKNHPADVTVFVDGLAASAASFISMAGDKVIMTRNSEMMIHDAHGLVIGNSADMRELADLLDKMSDNIADIYMQKAGGTVSSWREAMKTETWYSADEAVKAGLADEIQGKTSTENSWDLSIFSYTSRKEAPEPKIEPESEQDEEFDFDVELFQQALQEVCK